MTLNSISDPLSSSHSNMQMKLPGKWLVCVERSVAFPGTELVHDKLFATVVDADEIWFTGLVGTTDTTGDVGAHSTWFCCAPAATAYPDTGGGGVLGCDDFWTGSSPLLASWFSTAFVWIVEL